MVYHHCMVPGCTSNSKKWQQLDKYPWMEGVTFLCFPKDDREKRAWVRLSRRSDFSVSMISKWTRMCSRHFINGRVSKEHPRPELFPHNNWKQPVKYRESVVHKLGQHQQESESGVVGRREGDFRLIKVDRHTGEVSAYVTVPSCVKSQINQPRVITEITPCPPDHSYALGCNNIPDVKDGSTQTDLTMEEIARFEETTKQGLQEKMKEIITADDDSVNYYTGIPSKAILTGMFDAIQGPLQKVKYWTGPSSADKKVYEIGDRGKPGPARKLDLFTEYIMVLIWMRLGLPLRYLGDLFGVAQSTVSNTLITWVHIFHQLVTPVLLTWPSQDQVRRYMPAVFKQHKFDKTRAVIDCTEFFMQKPHKPDTQYKTYSSYKSHNTLKALVAVTPSGAFSFVSNMWSRNVSDKHITKHCGFIEELAVGDEVMADRGFQIEDLLLPKNVKLIAPPFTRKCSYGKGKRLNAAEIRRTRSIAHCRIHVERAIGRMKNWRIVKYTMPVSISGIASELCRVIAGFCNLKPPLVQQH